MFPGQCRRKTIGDVLSFLFFSLEKRKERKNQRKEKKRTSDPGNRKPCALRAKAPRQTNREAYPVGNFFRFGTLFNKQSDPKQTQTPCRRNRETYPVGNFFRFGTLFNKQSDPKQTKRWNMQEISFKVNDISFLVSFL